MHLVINSVMIPAENDEDHLDLDKLDLELMLKKSLLESESEWNRSNSKPIIDTKTYKGDLSRYMPTKGTF